METIVILAGVLFGFGLGILFMVIKPKVKKEYSEKKPNFDKQANGGELPPSKPPTRPNP